jgi:hypothetical protein
MTRQPVNFERAEKGAGPKLRALVTVTAPTSPGVSPDPLPVSSPDRSARSVGVRGLRGRGRNGCGDREGFTGPVCRG